jgi:hypothetical protein
MQVLCQKLVHGLHGRARRFCLDFERFSLQSAGTKGMTHHLGDDSIIPILVRNG